MRSNADVGVSSTHKMLSSLTQGAILAAKSELLDIERLSTIVDMVQTTSPSVWIYGSIDANRRQMMLAGRQLLQRTLELSRRLRSELAEIDGLQVLGPEIVDGRTGAEFDPTRVLVDVHWMGVTGYEAEMILRNEHRIFVEMSDLVSVLLLITIGDTDESVNRAVAGFSSLAEGRSASRHDVQARSSGALLFSSEQVTSPRAAFMADSVKIPITLASGRVSVENITPYPPGIPVVTPGERLSREVIDYLQTGLSEGMYISGLADPTNQTVRVIR
jgi:lysine decarboxylase